MTRGLLEMTKKKRRREEKKRRRETKWNMIFRARISGWVREWKWGRRTNCNTLANQKRM
jgi:hypothetical protein